MYHEVSASDNPVETAFNIKRAMVLGWPCIYVHRKPGDDLSWFYHDVAKALGTPAPIAEDENGNKTGGLHAHIKYPWAEASPSYSHSNTSQPLHTDGAYESKAPDVVYFFCQEQARHGGHTIFISNKDLIKYLQEDDPVLLDRLRTEPVTFSKGNDSKTQPIIGRGDRLAWNWHRGDLAKQELTCLFNTFLRERVVGGGLCDAVLLEPGEAVFFLDDECLHGRNSFIGDRWLIKGGVYFDTKTLFPAKLP